VNGWWLRLAGAERSSDSNIQQVRGTQKMKSQAATCPLAWLLWTATGASAAQNSAQAQAGSWHLLTVI
jgi:hypothetical protein